MHYLCAFFVRFCKDKRKREREEESYGIENTTV